MKLSINKAHFPVTVLGYGRRIGIWTQGCSIHCKGCVSQDTWDYDPNKKIAVEELLQWCQQVAADGFDGITISGGEPFEQAAALAYFLDQVRKWVDTLYKPIDILCYTGLPYKIVQKRHAALLAKLDVLIPEPYVDNLPVVPLRGSSNQPRIFLTSLAHERYGEQNQTHLEPTKRFQMTVDEERVWFVGIPERGDMDRLQTYCEANGVFFNTVSWRA